MSRTAAVGRKAEAPAILYGRDKHVAIDVYDSFLDVYATPPLPGDEFSRFVIYVGSHGFAVPAETLKGRGEGYRFDVRAVGGTKADEAAQEIRKVLGIASAPV
jgi:hypothetical protein